MVFENSCIDLNQVNPDFDKRSNASLSPYQSQVCFEKGLQELVPISLTLNSEFLSLRKFQLILIFVCFLRRCFF